MTLSPGKVLTHLFFDDSDRVSHPPDERQLSDIGRIGRRVNPPGLKGVDDEQQIEAYGESTSRA